MDVRIIDELVSVVVDPVIHALDASFFKTITGTPTIASSKYRYNSAETNTYPEFVYGEYEFPLVIPVAPTGGHARSWGLRGKSLGNRGAMVFDISGTTFSVKVYDKDGTVLSRSIDWNAAWTNVEVKFRIGWSATGTTFSIVTGTAANDISVRLVPTAQNFSANLPLGISIVNGVADNMDLTHIYILQAGRVRGISAGGTISSITPGTGATDLGKAEDSPHASGDVGIQMLAVRRDTAASSAGTDGDYATLNEDVNGNLWSTLGTLQSGEVQDINAIRVEPQASYTNISASALIYTGAGRVAGFVVNSCAAGATIKLWDNTSAATTVLLNTITFTAAVNQGPVVVTLPAFTRTTVGLYATIAVAAMDVTIMWRQTT